MDQDCQNITNNLIDIAENNLSESPEKEILDHLAVCPRCKERVEDFSKAWKELPNAEKSIPSENFWSELLIKIQDHEQPPSIQEKMLTVLKNSLRPAAVSLSLIAGVFLGYQLGNFPHMKSTRSEITDIGLYTQDFRDFPEGSTSDFIMKYEIPIEVENREK
jgi:hypothetical protein